MRPFEAASCPASLGLQMSCCSGGFGFSTCSRMTARASARVRGRRLATKIIPFSFSATAQTLLEMLGAVGVHQQRPARSVASRSQRRAKALRSGASPGSSAAWTVYSCRLRRREIRRRRSPVGRSFLPAQGKNRRPAGSLLDEGDRAFDQGEVRGRQSVARRHRPEQIFEAFVEILHAEQVVQHALVNAQRALRQRLSLTDFNQTPAAQRRGGDHCAPVRVAQVGECQTEGRVVALRVALKLAA